MRAFYRNNQPIQLITPNMAKKTEISVEEKLRALFDLQIIDSRIDEIRNVRGELPLEVEDLENEIAGMDEKLKKLTSELSDFDLGIKENKNIIESANGLIAKYAEKLKNVRNNREYNSIVKEEEYQQLEIQLAEKKIKELTAQTEQKKETIELLNERLSDKKNHLSAKKDELQDPLISKEHIYSFGWATEKEINEIDKIIS